MLLRAFVYKLLSQLTGTAPTVELFSSFPKEVFSSLAQELPALAAIQSALQSLESDPKLLAKTEQDYADLYVGPNPLPAPIWESVYRDPEHKLFSSWTLAVRAFYAKHQLAFANRKTEPDDAIFLECAFMAHLAGKTHEALLAHQPTDAKALRLAQAEFLNTHLAMWAPQCFALQLPHCQTPLYQAVAQLIITFIPQDQAYLSN